MQQSRAELVEIRLEEGLAAGRLQCPPAMLPAAGRYLLAHEHGSDAPLPVPVFNAGPAPGGFLAAPPLPANWRPGSSLLLHGPLGRGFSLPTSARKVALAALAETVARLRILLQAALEQGASVVLVGKHRPDDLPPEVETQPESALGETARWADYLAIDIERESMGKMSPLLGLREPDFPSVRAQVLVRTPLSCGGMGACGVCAVRVRRGWRTACKDGPVFELGDLAI